MSPPPFSRLLLGLNTIFWLTSKTLSQSSIEYLPGFAGKLPFKLETGYVGVGESEEIQLFYYFIESEGSPLNDPLFLWLTGGPGCSGLSSLFYEIGPLHIDYAKSGGPIPALRLNPYSWTKVANIIFLDQPAGTGFSYAKTADAYKCNDTLSVRLTYHFLEKWLVNHPKYLKNPLYITGGSYSGITVPLVVQEVYNGIEAGSNPHLNLQGYLLGNPITDLNGMMGEINGRIPYAHRMGLLSDELYMSAEENCNGDYINIDPDNDLCKDDVQRINECVDKITTKHILEPWCDVVANGLLMPLDEQAWCRALTKLYSSKWANTELVQKALKIREGTVTEWARCNYTLKQVDYTYDVDSTVVYHKNLSHKDCRALIYSGDHDMMAPHTATEQWIRSLKLQTQSAWRPWYVEGQIAGYTSTHSHSEYELTYATVKGAGHTPAEYKPLQCLPMIERWLNNHPL